jgi:predicted metal-dependent RNase
MSTGAESNGTPYLYVPEVSPLSNIDAVVLTHAHLDHCGMIPLLFKYGYEGPVYMTPPTRDLMGLLQLDYIEVANREGKRPPYDSAMIRETLKHTITLNYGDVTDIAPDMRLTFYNSGHILGSACAHRRSLYNVAPATSVREDQALRCGDQPVPRVETVIIDHLRHARRRPQRKEAEIERGRSRRARFPGRQCSIRRLPWRSRKS